MITLSNISPKDSMSALGAITADQAFSDQQIPTSWVRPGKFSRSTATSSGRRPIHREPYKPIRHTSSQAIINVYPAAPTADAPEPGWRTGRPTRRAVRISTALAPSGSDNDYAEHGNDSGSGTGSPRRFLGESIDAIYATRNQNALLVRERTRTSRI